MQDDYEDIITALKNALLKKDQNLKAKETENSDLKSQLLTK